MRLFLAFPNLASYLSKPAIKERTDPEFRRETISKRQNDEVENFMKADRYSAFTFVLDQSRLWKFGELYGKTVTE
jgi:hypothetical protein